MTVVLIVLINTQFSEQVTLHGLAMATYTHSPLPPPAFWSAVFLPQFSPSLSSPLPSVSASSPRRGTQVVGRVCAGRPGCAEPTPTSSPGQQRDGKC